MANTEPPPAGPSGSASSTIEDPGITVTDLPVAPTPGAPTADKNNLLTIFVPADSTTLQMGASSHGPNLATPAISGFRVSTATHAHVTAQSPLTTISLGAVGGQGMADGVDGLSLYTEGKKYEHVELDAKHEFEANRVDNVKGNWDLTIEGFWNFECKKSEDRETHQVKNEMRLADSNEYTIANKFEFTKGTTTEIQIGDKNEFHQGASIEVTIGDSTETTHGNSTGTTYGNSTEEVHGITSESFRGAKSETNFAAMYERTIGLKTEVMVGGSAEMTMAAALEVFGGAKAEITKGILYEKNSAVKKGDAEVEAKEAALEKHETNLRIRKLQVELKKVESVLIYTATTQIHK